MIGEVMEDTLSVNDVFIIDVDKDGVFVGDNCESDWNLS